MARVVPLKQPSPVLNKEKGAPPQVGTPRNGQVLVAVAMDALLGGSKRDAPMSKARYACLNDVANFVEHCDLSADADRKHRTTSTRLVAIQSGCAVMSSVPRSN